MKYVIFFIGILMIGTLVFSGFPAFGSNHQIPQIPISSQNDLMRILGNIINFLLRIGAVVAIVMLIYAGFLFMTGAGNDDKISAAKKILLYVAIGIGVMMFSYSAVSIVDSLLNGSGNRPPSNNSAPPVFRL